jgi:hypothetical protein
MAPSSAYGDDALSTSRRPRIGVLVATVLVAFVLSAGPVAAATPVYGGWQTTNFKGIEGYLRQNVTSSTTGLHAVWITLCGHNSCGEWLQTGTYQGSFAGGSSPGSVHVYYENVDPCGSYYKGDLGAPGSADYPYRISPNGGARSFTCPNGVPFTGYSYAYRKGSYSSTPFFYGVISTSDGLAMAKTEVQGGAPVNYDFFGCDPGLTCADGAYGIELLAGTTWRRWSATDSSTASHGNPPYLHTFQSHWSFKTCPVSC